ncbi:conserved hypothetical protein [Candidatus Terasakiella magnetica]|nr:conserved hypothetical protein [Candidatus Terasakiella magnetica]
MSVSKTNPAVEKQYRQWVYPEPVTDLAMAIETGGYQIADPTLVEQVLWPDRPMPPNTRILVAGCGTHQAAWLAYTNPKSQVLGIDLSDSSLALSQALKAKHKLDNLRLMRLDLHDVAQLGESFDFVISTGVLHHLPEPKRGLLALKEVLAEDGVMHLMLYGRYHRAGVYMIQDALARMGVEQTQEGVNFTRMLVQSLPDWHAVQPYVRSAVDDLRWDGGVVDTFLHKQDRAYTIPQILDLVEDCGLIFQGWTDNLDYYPVGPLSGAPAIYQRVLQLPLREQWAVTELLSQSLGTHRFQLRKTQPANLAPFPDYVDFDGDALLAMIPTKRPRLKIVDKGDHLEVERNWHKMETRGRHAKALQATDGKRSVADIIRHCKFSTADDVQSVRDFIRLYWQLGHITLGVAPPPKASKRKAPKRSA